MKKFEFKGNKKGKKLAILAGSVAAVVAVILLVLLFLRGRGDPVGVYHFSMIGLTEFWGDSQESYGPVTTDKIQTVFLSDTQTITEVLVKPGDKVKKGDVLMTYDTTLSELELERKRLDVERAKLQIKEAENELRVIRNMVPMSNSVPDIPQENTNWGKRFSALDKNKKGFIPYPDANFDGSSPEKALVCWVPADTPINDALLRELYIEAVDRQIKNAAKKKSSASEIPEEAAVSPSEETKAPAESKPEETQPPAESKPEETKPPAETKPEETKPPAETKPEETKPPAETNPPKETKPSEDKKDTTEKKKDKKPASTEPTEPEPPKLYSPDFMKKKNARIRVKQRQAVVLTFVNQAKCDIDHWELAAKPVTEGAPVELKKESSGSGLVVYGFPETAGTVEYTVWAYSGSKYDSYKFTLEVVEDVTEEKEVNSFDFILKTTQDDKERAPIQTWQGVHVIVYNGNTYGFQLFDAPSPSTFFPEDTDDTSAPEVDYGSGYTAAEIAEMRRDKEKEIKELTASAKMTEAEYNLMVREFNDGKITAKLDGDVISVLSEEEARQNKQPMVKVSGGGGFYVEGSVNELEKENLMIGQEVTVSDWNTGGTYTGKVCAIGDFPSDDGEWNGMGNPNASFYPFKVFVDGSADLQEDSYVSITYSAASAENGIYLENPFLRTENGETYVYVRGENDRLEKRTVITGKSLWGSYTEVLSGLDEDDYVAFPYGKGVRDGAATVEGDLSALYSY